MLRTLEGSGALSCGLPLDLAAGDSHLDPGEHPAAVGRQIGLAVRGDQQQVAFLRCVDPVFELTGGRSKSQQTSASNSPASYAATNWSYSGRDLCRRHAIRAGQRRVDSPPAVVEQPAARQPRLS
ncbi:hypothetical protein [Amycolatopsis sp. cmx-4-83]|uniref:hypothetical protein n=1 Tax=Amycolatopsis sp. cmx-4-83 TaxID=2790940 RepID=UPI00397C9C7B